MNAAREFFTVLSDLVNLKPPEPQALDSAYSKNVERLLMISQGMTQYRDLDQVLGYLLSAIRENFQIDCGVLLLENERVYRLRCHKGFPAAFVKDLSIPLGVGVLGDAAASGRGLILSKNQFSEILEAQSLVQEAGWGSFLMTPIMLESHNLGLFLAGSPNENYFSESAVDTLKPYLQVLSVGMKNAQLMEMMEKFNRRLSAEVSSTTQELTQTNERLIRRVRELKALYEITLAASTQSNVEDIFEAVAPRITDFFNVEHVGFFVNSAPKGHAPALSMKFPSFGIPSQLERTFKVTTEADTDSPLGAIAGAFKKGEIQYYHGRPVSLGNEFENFTEDPALLQHLEKIILRSLTAVPLKSAQGIHGVLVLANPGTPQTLNDEDLRTLILVGIRIATSLENAELETENRKRLADLSSLQEINEAFYATPVLEFVLAKIVRVVTKTFKCELCDFLLLESSSQLVPHPPSELSAISVRDTEDASSQVFFDKTSRIVAGGDGKTRSMLLVPLKVEQEVIGILRLGSEEEGFFDEGHMRLAELIADRSAVIVQNARLYEKILAANRELERLNRVKTEFVSMVSHELRTPVTAIKGFVDVVLCEDAGPINEQQRRFLNIAHNSIERLSLLISDLLDISRIEAGQLKIILQPVSMEKLLQDCYDTYKASIESKKINFEFKIEKKIPLVNADESRVKQVIENLISNAMKFVSEKGFIRMNIEDLGDFVIISVADTGVGISKEDQDKIFSMFYQVDSSLTRKVGGTGLGLAISKAIVEMHGGRIWVESEPGKGSIFRFLLPRYREAKVKEYTK